MIFADKLIQLRKKSGWSQEELAEQMEVSRQSVSKWEGAQSVPDLEKMVRLSKLFGVSTDYLLKDELEEADAAPVEEETRLRRVSMEEAQAFLSARAEGARVIARATLLCIVSPICLFLLAAASEAGILGLSENVAGGVGMIILLALVAVAVAQFISVGNRCSRWTYLEREPFEAEYGVCGMVRERQADDREGYNRSCMLGVCICILSVLPLFFGMMAGDNGLMMVVMLCLTLAIAGVGVYLLVRSGVVWASYEKLLQEGEFGRTEKKSRGVVGAVSTVYWLTAVAVYLALSLPNDSWDRSWIVWPVAGVLYAAVRIVAFAVTRRRK